MNESYFESIFAIFDGKSPFMSILNWIIFWQNSNIELNQIGYRPPLFYAENENIFSSEDFDRDSLGDSMTRGRSLLQKVKMIIQFSPAFLASLVFEIVSISSSSRPSSRDTWSSTSALESSYAPWWPSTTSTTLERMRGQATHPVQDKEENVV